MIYPLNIFTPDPVTNNIRPFIIFMANKVQFNVMKGMAYGVTDDMLVPAGGFTLPMPNGGLIDSSSNDYGEDASGFGKLTQNAISGGQSIVDGVTLGAGDLAAGGIVADPRLTQVYKGTSARTWSGEWQIVPQSKGEAAAAAAILWFVKYSAAPDRAGNDKMGLLIQPHIYRIIFSNPVLQLALQFDKMALVSYSINYFAQGYASTYGDMMPKHMSLTMEFKEYGIKTKKDWIPFL